ncbi:unnamed protein product [Closterium sp. NIES-54]
MLPSQRYLSLLGPYTNGGSGGGSGGFGSGGGGFGSSGGGSGGGGGSGDSGSGGGMSFARLNLWPRVSLPETLPTLHWTGDVGDALAFQVWGSRAFVRDFSADKLCACAIPCVFLGFPPDAPGWQFYHPTSRRVFPSQDVTFDESVPFQCLFPYPTAPLPHPAALPCSRSPSDAARGAASRGAEPRCAVSEGAGSGGAEPGGAEPGGAEPGGAEPAGAEPGGAEPEGVEPGDAESEGAESGGAEQRGTTCSGGPAGASPQLSPRPEPLSPQQLREWFAQRTRLRSGAVGARVSAAGDTGAGGVGLPGLVVLGALELEELDLETSEPGGARAGGTGAGGAGAGGAGAGDTGAVGARAAGTGTGGNGAGGAGVGDTGTVDPGAGGAGAGGALSGHCAAATPASPLPAPSPYTEQTGGLTEPREPESCPASPVRAVCTGRRVPHPRLPPIPGTHTMALRPSSVPLRVSLPPLPESSLPAVPDPESDLARGASPSVSRLLATVVTDPSIESTAASALVVELVDFAAACRLDYATALVVESASASPPSVGGECALGKDVLEDRQEDLECLAAAVPHFASMLLAPEGDPDAPDIATPRSYVEAITSPYTSQWQASMDAEMASWKSTGTYVDAFPPYLGLQMSQDRARRTITLTQSHLAHQVLKRFGFQFSSPQPTPLSTSHSLSAPPSVESVEPNGSYPELVGCLMYLMTCTQPDLAYPLSLSARYVAPGRHRKVHWDAAKRVLRYLCSTSGMGLVLGEQGPVVLTAHADASWELRWLTYVLTDLGEQPHSPPILYVDNKAMIALCQEQRLEHRMKHIDVRYFLARELQQCGQLRLAYVATRANTADIFTKALPPRDHQRFSTIPRPPFFEGCSPSPLAPSYASAAAADVSLAEDVGVSSASAKRRSSKGKGGRGGGGGSGGGGGGSGSGGGGSSGGGGGSGGGGSGGSRGGGTGGGRTGPRRGGPGGGYAEGDCYQCLPPDPGIAAAALGASESGTLPGTAPVEALHTFTLDSGASRCFFRDTTTLTPLPAPVPVKLGDPSRGPVVARSSTVLPCPAPEFIRPLHQHLLVLRLHSDRGGEFSSDLLRDFCHGEGILQSFMLPDSPQQNGIAGRHIGLVMEVARTSMIHAAAPHFLWSFAVRYAAHQLNLWPRVSLPETSPTLRWTGEVGDASVFRFYHPTSRRVIPSQVVRFDESVPFYCFFLYRSAPPPPPPLFLARGPPPVDLLLSQGPAPSGVSQVDPLLGTAPVEVVRFNESVPFYCFFPYRSAPPPPPPLFLARGPPPVDLLLPQGPAPSGAASGGAASGGAEPGGAESEGAGSWRAEPGSEEPGGAEPASVEPGGAEPEGVEPGGAESKGAESLGAEPQGAALSGGPAGASPQLSPQQLREWLVRRAHLPSGATGARGAEDAGAGGAGVTAEAAGPGGARTKGAGATGTGGVGGAGARDPAEPGVAGAGGSCAGGAGAGAGGAGIGGTGAGGTGAARAGAVDPGARDAGGTVRPRPYFVPLL